MTAALYFDDEFYYSDPDDERLAVRDAWAELPDVTESDWAHGAALRGGALVTAHAARNPFSTLVTAAIVVNLPVAALVEFAHDETAEIAERVDGMLLAFFAIEIAVRVALAIKHRQWDRWLAIDATIIVLALLPIGLPLVLRGARLAHLARHGMHLKHVTLARAPHI